MNNKSKVAEYIRDHPNMMNEQIATELNINENSVKAYISQLKKDVYTRLLARYLDDFELTDDVDQHLKLGNSILRILENL